MFTMYGRNGHLGHVTETIFTNLLVCPLFPRRFCMKFGLDLHGVSEKTMFENNVHIHFNSPEPGADNPLGSIFL